MDSVLVVLGLVGLVLGGHLLVDGAVALSRRFGVSRMVIGLTVVAFGTSAPELVVSVNAALREMGSISMGNVIGSNIGNIGLILALSALVCPLAAKPALVRRDLPLLLLGSVLLGALLWDGTLGRWDGAALLLFFGVNLYFVLRGSKFKGNPAEPGEDQKDSVPSRSSIWRGVLLTVGGLALLVGGADLFVRGAVSLAQDLGISERIIGLTLVAVGTSLPEMATSLIAAFRKEGDIAIANIVGSNLFNASFIAGAAAAAKPLALDAGMVRLDFPVMCSFSVAMAIMVWSGRVLSRWEGGALLASYGSYLVFLFIKA